MKTIWKFHLPIGGEKTLEHPGRMRPLCVGLQNGQTCLWGEVDPTSKEKGSTHILCYGTGHEIDDSQPDVVLREYIGTVHQMGGALVFHYYYVKDVEPRNARGRPKRRR